MSYFPSAVDFDGANDYLTRGATLTGAADAKTGTLSFWFRLDVTSGSVQRILTNATTVGGTTGRLFVELAASGGALSVVAYNAAGTEILLISTTASFPTSTKWVHVCASWDLNTAGARHLYVNGASDISVTTFTNDTIDYTLADWSVGARCDGSTKFAGCLADLYFNPAEYVDLSNAANLAKFVTTTARPVDLGSDGSTPTGTAPLIYLHNAIGDAASSFATNDGTGGNFSVTGSLDTATSFPALYHFGSAATPEDAASEINEPVTSAITPPTGMTAGDLVLLWGQLQVASANASITQSELGGQTWEQVSLTAQGNDQSVNLYFCTFDGTWDADPSIAFAAQSGTQPATCGMHVFRPPSTSYTWALDSAAAFSAFAAPSTPFTVTRSGQTLNNDNTVTLAGWFTGDDNSWTSIAGTGWSVTGTAQYRNTAGSDQSASFAHYINATAGSPSPSTGDVSKNQTTVTGDAGITVIATFYASAPSPDATANPSGVVGTGAAGTPTVSGDANVSITGASATGSAGDLTVTIGVDVSAALSGVQATGAAGDMAVTGTADVSITGVSATGSAGTLTVSGDAAASITGVSATGSAGDLTVGIGFDVSITGVSATGSAGEFSISGDSVLTLSGVSATGFAGELTTSESKEVLLTGVSGTGQAGDVTVSTTADVSTELAGVSATGQAGDLTVTGSASVDITGVSATGSAGEQSITGDANVDVSGVQATGSAGELTVSTAVNVEVTPSGVSAIGSAGDLIATGTADVSITGVAATGFAGELTITADASATIDGVSATGQAGNLSIEAGAVVLPSGVVGTGFAGTISVTGDANVDITGVSATGSSGTLTVSTDGETTNVDLTGVSATGSAGTLSITGDANVSITGVGATAEAGTLTISAGALAEISGVSATGSAGDLTVTGTAVVDLFGVTATGQAGDLVASSNDVSVTLLGVSATGMVGLLEASVDQIPELSSVGGRGVIKGRKKKGFTVFEQQVTRKDAVVILRGASSKGIAGSIFVETMKPERARRRRIATALVLS